MKIAETITPAEPATSERLSEVVQDLKEEVWTLTEAIDELRELMEWALNNDRFRSRGQDEFRPVPFRLTSMPKDLHAPDFGDRLNRFKPEHLPPEQAPPPPEEENQRDLFSSRTKDGV